MNNRLIQNFNYDKVRRTIGTWYNIKHSINTGQPANQRRSWYLSHLWNLFFIFFTRLILSLFDHVEFCDWAVIKKIFPTDQQHSLVAQRGPTSHPLFSISLVYTPFFWRSCCLTLPVSGNCPSYTLDFRLLVPHQWQPTAKAVYSVSWICEALWCFTATY